MRRAIRVAGIILLSLTAGHAAATDDDRVRVLYAGSLVHLLEQRLGPAFEQESGLRFEGYAGGSNKLAKEIRDRLRRADVFISASPKVNDELSGAAHGDWLGWYATFAQSPLLIGYNPRGRFADSLRQQRWDRALTQPGIRLGRTDPQLDPKGAFVIQLLQQAQQVYADPTLSARMLGDPENPSQVLPEEALVGRLQAGQLDAGFFYSTETSELKIPALRLPPEFAIQASYTISILKRGPNPAGAERFVRFVLGPRGRQLLQQAGIEVLPRPSLHGDLATLPPSLRGRLSTGEPTP